MNSRRIMSLLLAGASLAVLATSANAQTAPSQGGTVGEVVVTGSRVITNGNNAPTPITVMQVETAMALRPTMVADALNDLPTFSGSQGQSSNPGTTSAASSAAAVLNLRNMGATRTLILFDGHRLAPTEIDATVDVNMVPQMLLQRVDVVTGGASAVYGSDAVTGVVNFITDTKFNGVKVKAQVGQTTYGDGHNESFGVAGGRSFLGGRLHVEGSYEHFNDEGVNARSNRQWGRNVYTVQGSGTAAAPYVLVTNTRNANTSFGGLVNQGVLAGRTFSAPGVLTPFVHGTAYTGGFESGGDGAYHDGSLKAALRSDQLFSRVDFELTDSIHAYLAATSTWNVNNQYATYTTLNNITLSSQNAYLPAVYQTQLSAAGQPTLRLSKVLQNSQRLNPNISERQLFVVAGLNGTFGDSYRWEASYSHSENNLRYVTKGIVNNGNLSAALDAVTNPANGQVVCRVTLTNPTVYPGCVPLNVFGPGTESPAALDYIYKTGHVGYHFIMDDLAGSIAGSPFKTWAGPVTVALSGEYRDLLFSVNSDVKATDLANCTGLLYNCTATTQSWTQPTNNRSPVHQRVSEVALEGDVPLLKDAPLAQSLNLNLAARYTNYNISGSATTWKVGLDWHLNEQLTFRATRSRDIRAPNLNNLFSAATLVSIPSTDLLTKTSPLVPTAFGGNPKLTPEIADTSTAGVVYRPEWLPRFSISLDAYDITINDAISAASGSNALFQNLCYASGGSSPYCQLQVRPINYTDTSVANTVTQWFSSSINIAQQKTRGADLEVNYSADVFDRPFSIRTLVDYQPHITYSQPGVLTYDMAGSAFNSNNLTAAPIWRASAFLHFSPFENFSVDVLERWRSSLQFAPTTTLVFATPTIKPAAYTNLNLNYSFKTFAQTDLYLTVSNLFNKQPTPAANFGANGSVGTAGGFVNGDDAIGRSYTVGIRMRF